MAAEIAGIAGTPAPQVLSVQGVAGGTPLPVTMGGGGTGDVNIQEYGGVATSLGQKAMAASMPVTLASDQSPLPVTVSAGTDRTATGAITNTQNVEINTQASGACGVQLSGVWTGTVVFEATVDGVIWNPVLAVNSVTDAEVTQTTVNGNWIIACAGFQKVRARGNTVTSGSATVFLYASTCPQVVTIGGSIPEGSATIGGVEVRDGANQLDVNASGQAAIQDPPNLDVALSTRLNTLGQKAMVASAPVVIASDQSALPITAAALPLPTGAATAANQTNGAQLTQITDGTDVALVTAAGALVVDGSAVTQPVSAVALPLPTGAATEATLATRAAAAQLPAALVGGRLDENIGAWLGSTAPTVGQKVSASSIPVVLASDQPSIPVAVTPNVVGVQGNAWNAAAVAANGVSASIDCQYTPNISVFGNASGTTKITVQFSQDDANFYDATEQNIPSGGDFSISGAWGARYIRLKSSQARTITATVAGKG